MDNSVTPNSAGGSEEQRTTVRDYEEWFHRPGLGARWARFWFGPGRTLSLNTPIRRLPAAVGLRPTDRVLDIGCGAGGLLFYLHRAVGFTVPMDGVDASASMLAWARREVTARGLEGRIRLADGLATALPYATGSFDLVISTYVIKHLSDSSLRTMLGEVSRVLKPGGRFVVWEGAPAKSNAMRWFNLRLLQMVASVAHLRTTEQLRGFMEEAGFRDMRPFGHGPYYYYPPLPRVGFIASRP